MTARVYKAVVHLVRVCLTSAILIMNVACNQNAPETNSGRLPEGPKPAPATHSAELSSPTANTGTKPGDSYDVKKCRPKIIREGETPSQVHIKPGEKPTGYDPVVAFRVLETGDVIDVVLKRSSGVRDKDNFALTSARGMKFNSRPGCGTIESEASATIDLR